MKSNVDNMKEKVQKIKAILFDIDSIFKDIDDYILKSQDLLKELIKQSKKES